MNTGDFRCAVFWCKVLRGPLWDFKSSASAIPPPGHWHYELSELKRVVQQCLWRW